MLAQISSVNSGSTTAHLRSNNGSEQSIEYLWAIWLLLGADISGMSSFTQTGSQSSGRASVASSPSTAPRPSALSNRLTSVLSASYADSDIRDALETLDERNVRNTAETRRQLRLDVQKEVIDSNGAIIKDFGKAAEVSVTAHCTTFNFAE